MKRAEKEEIREWLATTDNDYAKAIIEAMLFRCSLKGRLYHFWEAVKTFPVVAIFCLAECSPAIIAIVAFWVAFICVRLSTR